MAAPYTGTLPFVVEALEPGCAQVSMRDGRGVRNHLSSIHAMALANLGEVATGLALNFGLAAGRRAILVAYEMRYLKKARGRLVASCQVDVPPPDGEVIVEGRIQDEGGNLVAEARAVWKVGTIA